MTYYIQKVRSDYCILSYSFRLKKSVIKRHASISTETTLQYPHHFTLQPSTARLSTTKASGSEGSTCTSPILSPPQPQAYSGTAWGMLRNACAVSTGTSHQRKVYYLCCVPLVLVTANKLCHISQEFPNKVSFPL